MKGVILLLTIVASLGFTGIVYAQNSGGVDVDGFWYLGEGLKKGDYFEYTVCDIDLNSCLPIELKIWIKGDRVNVSETLWDAQILVVDQDKIIKGSWGLGKTVPTPILFDDDLSDYAIAFKSSIAWLSAYVTSNENDRIHGPQEFKNTSWGSLGPVGGGLVSNLIPNRVETITTPSGTLDTIVVGWYNENDNEIWLVDDFPFPVKAKTFAGMESENVPIMYEFELQQYKQNITEDPFKDVVESINKGEELGCDTKFLQYTSKKIPTNTYSLMVQYNHAPETPLEGCDIDWKINFYSKYNETKILKQIHYDVWVVDEDDKPLYSYAQSIGKEFLFTEYGQVEHLLPINQESGIVRYAVFVYGSGPENELDPELGGYAIIEVQVEKNPLLEKLNDNAAESKIPSWIKNNAKWWADGTIDDDAFTQGIGFLIKEGTIAVESTSQNAGEIKQVPEWIKNNAKWWADGTIDDDAFTQGIEFLVKEGIIQV